MPVATSAVSNKVRRHLGAMPKPKARACLLVLIAWPRCAWPWHPSAAPSEKSKDLSRNGTRSAVANEALPTMRNSPRFCARFVIRADCNPAGGIIAASTAPENPPSDRYRPSRRRILI